MSVKAYQNRHCNRCNKETKHIAKEDALEIEYECTECHNKTEMVKSFF
ncbi:hypothetical protein SM124_07005 [Bacillus sp. 31A1R]|uniref:Uncharacterized protein n=1 Tax=Robertmurraya mangrovi TaxID=3098077 RepID=A0ABU5IWG6_9BACI|nr:hypothetical protein [Bacillus sp. 31A1R]MDZ5471494.1 hypothetical protein [Bacillus sp. 31A1R]